MNHFYSDHDHSDHAHRSPIGVPYSIVTHDDHHHDHHDHADDHASSDGGTTAILGVFVALAAILLAGAVAFYVYLRCTEGEGVCGRRWRGAGGTQAGGAGRRDRFPDSQELTARGSVVSGTVKSNFKGFKSLERLRPNRKETASCKEKVKYRYHNHLLGRSHVRV